MSNYAQLMSKLEEKDEDILNDSLKKLLYLTLNDQKRFEQHAGKLVKQLQNALSNIVQFQTKLLCLQLLSEIATNFQKSIPSHMYDFPQLVSFLSDDNAEVRKAAHYLLLTYVKKYQEIDSVIKGYHLKIQTSSEQWKIVQKVIHSFQSLLIIEPRCVTYGSDYGKMDGFMEAVLENRNSDNHLIKKASEQAVSSFVKNQYVPTIVAKLSEHIVSELKSYADKNHIHFVANVEPKKKIETENLQLQEINLNTNSKKQPKKSKTSIQLKKLIDSIQSSTDWKVKCDTIEQISSLLSNTKLGLDEFPEDVLEKVLQLTYDYNFKTCITAMNVLLILVNDYPEISVGKQKRLEEIVIDKVCDIKMAVRQVACRILRKIFYGHHSKTFLKFLLNKMSTCSVIGKEQILNFLQQAHTNAEQQKPTSEAEVALIVGEVSVLLSNQNTRIKIKAIDCLVRISQATGPQQCKAILQKKLNKVYYDMYLERLREKEVSTTFEKWSDKNTNVNKGATWQGQNEKDKFSVDLSDKPFMTKMQFSSSVNRKSDTTQDLIRSDEVGFEDTRRIMRNFNDTKTTSKTKNTFNTFSSTDNSHLDRKITVQYPTKAESVMSADDYSNIYRKQREKEALQEAKKVPMKPNPVKKRPANEENQDLVVNENLVIQSKQYMDKNLLEEIKEEKPTKMMKFKSRPKEKRQVSVNKEQQLRVTQTKPMLKSQSKKQHQIDYKATQYISKDELLPSNSPKELLREIVSDLPKQNDWSRQFEGLNGLRRLIKHHPEFYPSIQQVLPSIMPEVLKLVESLRSVLAKNGMMTLSEMCEAFKKSMDPFLEGIFAKLFKKALDTNSFIIEEVNKCIVSLCAYCSNQKIVTILLTNSQTKSLQAKIKVIYSIDRLVVRTNYSLQLLKENPKAVGILSNYIVDGSAQVRTAAKNVFLKIGQANSKVQIENIFKRGSSREAWQKWKGIIDKELNILTIGSHKRMEYD